MGRSVWGELDERAGVPVVFAAAPGRSGVVVTNAARVRQHRFGETPGEAAERVVRALAHGGVPAETDAEDDGLIAVRVDGECWWAAWPQGSFGGMSIVARSAARLRGDRPVLVQAGRQFPWAEVAATCGEDALVWAALGSASTASPVTMAHPVEILSARSDRNPLSLVRRAHARAVAASSAHPVSSTCESPDTADHELRIALVLASRATHDAEAVDRTRPAVGAVEAVAARLLRHLERAPEERTDLPAVRAARKVISDALCAADVAAPVPY